MQRNNRKMPEKEHVMKEPLRLIIRCIGLICMVLMAGCATSALAPSNSADATRCEDPRPMVCTMEYMPVCADLVAGGKATYPSGCNACADVAVASWVESPCEEE